MKEVVGNMKRFKRVLSVLLAIAMIIGTMPESGLFASAEGTESYWVDVDLEMTGGKIEGVPTEKVDEGEVVTLKAVPDNSDMTVVSFSAYTMNPETHEWDVPVPGIMHPSIDTISFPMPGEGVVVSASFSEHGRWRVFARDMEHGTIEVDPEIVDAFGGSREVTLTVRPDNGYAYVDDSLRVWEYKGPEFSDLQERKYVTEEVVAGSVFTMEIGGNTEVYAEFEELPHTTPHNVTVEETEGGVITSDLVTAEAGWTVTLTTTPDEFSLNEIDHLEVTGAETGKIGVTDNGDGTFTFLMPDEDVTVSGDFAVPTHTVNLVNNDPYNTGCHITDVGGFSSVEYGSNVYFSVYVAADCSMNSLKIKGDVSGENITYDLDHHNDGSSLYFYRFTMPNESVTITANFSSTLYSLSADAEMTGTVSYSVNDGEPAAYATAARGSKVRVYYTPDSEKYVSSLTFTYYSEGLGRDVTVYVMDLAREGNTYSGVFYMPSGDVTIGANLDKPYAVNVTQPEEAVVLASAHRADAGETVTLRAYSSRYDCFKVDWTVTYEDGDGVHEVEVSHPYSDPDDTEATFVMPAADVTVTAVVDHIGVPYNDRRWNPTTGTVTSTVNYHYGCLDMQNISGSELSGGWYIVTSDKTFNSRLTVTGHVSVILAEGVTLTCKEGIGVRGSGSLSIYGQGEDTGKIVATGSKYDAGIGGDDSSNHGQIFIYGGTIDATGGKYAAGIGQGDEAEGSSGTISIYGGDVTGHGGGDAAGIGGGNEGRGAKIVIYGGTVHGHGGQYGAGIGAGDDRGPTTINIHGGTVYAYGGEYAAGIGEGYDASDDSSNGTITIDGLGSVSSTGGKLAAGIGGGFLNNTSMKIHISGGRTEAFGKDDDCGGAGIGAGSITSIRAVHLSGGDFNGEVVISGGEVSAIASGSGNSESNVYGCAGIGGGFGGNLGGNVTITGGDVKAVGYAGGAAIGGGSEFITGYGGECTGTVTITGGDVELKTTYPGTGSDKAVIIGHGDDGSDNGTLVLGTNMSVTAGGYYPVLKGNRVSTLQSGYSGSVFVNECEHSDFDYSYKDKDNHNANCLYCEHTTVMPHYFSDGVCVECGAEGIPVYFYNSGELVNYQVFPASGGLVEKPEEDPVKDGCEFLGWYVKSELGGYEIFDFSVSVTEETKLYALWQTTLSIDTYSITDQAYRTGGKVTLADGEPTTFEEMGILVGRTFTATASADAGYRFAGWAYANDLEDIISDQEELTTTITGKCQLVALFTADNSKIFKAHSLSLGGDIAVNFMVNLTEEQRENAVVNFFWFVNGKIKEESFDLSKAELTDFGYKAVCHVAAAEMTCDIYATVSINGEEQEELDVYSVKKYADIILGEEYAEEYLKEHTEEEYGKLTDLVRSMLDYGASAQLKWNINYDGGASSLANNGNYSRLQILNLDDPFLCDMNSELENYGLEYVGTTVVMLSETSLRHYYKITDPEKFELVKDKVKFDYEPVTYVTKGDNIYFELTGISAADINNGKTLIIGETAYDYSVTDYIWLILKSGDTEELKKTKALVIAMYYYNQAADAYMGTY